MPHLFLPRPRKFALGLAQQPRDECLGRVRSVLRSHQFWERLNTYTYLVGGVAFVVGSVFFLPSLANLAAAGSWIFIVASIFYFVVSVHDAAELACHCGRIVPPPSIDAAAAWSYIFGSVFFLVGSACYLPGVGRYTGGAWCFIVGSVLFVAGAILNGLQIFEAPNIRDARYMLLTAVNYVVGSVMFLVPSIIYLFNFDSGADENEMYAFAAAVYIMGSLFFTIGGIINYVRARGLGDVQDASKLTGGSTEEPLLLDSARL